ncbi:uncharacterized protein TRAVEDRAFT_45041 [Trametes versicolor FP-101664 SS1]|uniref:uncharacterized protein n=1 Tax=Trametes versicolor (strain FP-101664) TaxID=717944 RepID=UPI000462378D|nr:uncharacterized protein TRAVEDRAFT_45041 [Trametes versicolor FP-101664 SS1]EIW62205.1 hypothetical protein TRAVEDRAFT_45041 [Trametes versicolor FP-101664 SS1]
MSARYNLRNTRAGPVAPSAVPAQGASSPAPDDTTDASLVSSPLTGSSDLAFGPASISSGAERQPGLSYSQVVRSRTPSPVPSAGNEMSVTYNVNISPSPHVSGEQTVPTAGRTRPVTVEEVTDEEEGAPWIEVRRRRRSTGSLPVDRTPVARKAPLTAAQTQAVQAAENAISAADRERIERRTQLVRNHSQTSLSSDSSRGEGPSKDKGKAVDARNWGASGIPHDELQPEVQQRELDVYLAPPADVLATYNTDEQREMLAYWQARKEAQSAPTARAPSRHHGSRSSTLRASAPSPEPAPSATESALARELAALRHEVRELRESQPPEVPLPVLPQAVRKHSKSKPRAHVVNNGLAGRFVDSVVGAAGGRAGSHTDSRARSSSLRPMAQLEPGSYLGQAFNGIAGGDGPSDSGSSSSSSSSESSSDTDESLNGVDPDLQQRVEDQSRRHRKKKRKTKKYLAPVLKPEKPEPYDGRADAQIFHKFLRQMTEFIAGYRVKRAMHASTVSNYLTGTAYRFFVTTVSSDPRRWGLKELFVELFNYCFPVDYRLQMREKLRNCSQRDRSVRDYVHELESLFLMVGFVSERDMVDKLWNGLSISIQQELWKKELTPSHSSWSEVREAAELIEIAEKVGRQLQEDTLALAAVGPTPHEPS